MNYQKISAVFLKYRKIVTPLIFVLVLDILLLGTNYFIASELDIAATNINLAGRQRMLSQKMTKAASLIQLYEQSNVKNLALESRDELQHAAYLFDRTLMAFSHGGQTISASGMPIKIDKLRNIDTRVIQHALGIWEPIKTQLLLVTETPEPNIVALQNAIQLLADNNLVLLKQMNDLTNLLEADSEKKTKVLVIFQTSVVIFIFLSFYIASMRLYRKETYYEQLMEKTTDLVISIDVKTGVVNFISSSVRDMLGYEPEHFLHKSMTLLFADDSTALLKSILQGLDKTGKLLQDRCEVHMHKNNGEIIVADMVFQVTNNQDNHHLELSANIRDVSDRKKNETALAELAHKDMLTGLANRALFYELLERTIARSRRYNLMIAILFIDLDHFKKVNDKYGHHIGDALLVEVANLIKANVRESDTVCRFGGDEFVVLLDTVATKNMVEQIAWKIIEVVSQNHEIHGCECEIGASIGISLYPANGEDMDTLVRKADTAMYEVKKSGKNAIAYA